jgi:DNA polymerase-1
MTIEDAKNLLITLHDGFCLADKQSGVHALARIITPYCRGIMGFDHRPPVWHYSANRPRAGKDYLAGLAHLIYEGNYTEDAPIGKQPEETRKRITSAIRSGRRFMHFANCQGNLDDENFIGATTKIGYGDRSLGSNSGAADLTMRNEIEFSFSGNQGITFRPDVEPRTRKIELFFGEEDANSRKFLIADLHGFIVQNRWAIISAIDTLVTAWLASGAPLGQTPFTSFPRWAAVVGGIMTFHGLGDPCLPHNEDVVLCDSDAETAAMKEFFQVAYVAFPDQRVKTAVLTKLAADQAASEEGFDVFGELNEKSGQTRFGRMIRRYVGRELGGILLRRDGEKRKMVLQFSKGGGAARVSVFAGASAKAVDSDGIKHSQASGERAEASDPVHQEGGSPEENETKRETLSLRSLRTPFSSSQPNSFKEDYKKEDIIYDVYDSTSGGTLEKGDRGYRSDIEGLCFTGNLLVRHSDLVEVAAQLADSTSIALDLETYGTAKDDILNPRKGDIRLLILRGEGGPVIMLDLQAIGYDLGPLRAVLEKTEIIVHNGGFDLGFLLEKCAVRLSRVFCTCAGSLLLRAGLNTADDLRFGITFAEALRRHLDIRLAVGKSQSSWSASTLTAEQLAYAATNVAHLHRLAEKIRDHVAEEGLSEAMTLEMRLLPVVVDMKYRGVPVDEVLLQTIADGAARDAAVAAVKLRSLLGVPDLNPNSSPELIIALAGIGCIVPNTKADTLEKMPDPTGAIAALFAYRRFTKTSEQAQSFFAAIGSDGRIHSNFIPYGTNTGRFASSVPNLQNVQRGAMRTVFRAPTGRCFIVADYSQIELRVVAAVAGETRMLKAYEDRADLHSETAAALLEKPIGEVTKENRELAKAINFGLLYGMQAAGLVQYAKSSFDVTLTVPEAEQLKTRFFKRHQELARWHSQVRQKVSSSVSEVRTRLGRRRLISAAADGGKRFRLFANTEIQGGAADGMKQAMVDLAEKLPEGAFIVSTVHDELIVEAPLEIADQVKELTCSAMVKAMSRIYPEVPIVVEASVCSSWGEKA